MFHQFATYQLAIALLLVSLLAACGETDPQDSDNHQGHAEALRMEVSTLPGETLLAIWTDVDGWTDAEGQSIDTLPAPLEVDGTLQPLTPAGPPASLSIRIIDAGSEALDLRPAATDDEPPFEQTCSSYSVRYHVDGEDVLYWPPVAHPDSNRERPASTFVALESNEYGGVFHCDSVDLYPRAAGITSLRFLVWHGNHADESTDPIDLVVVDAE